MQLQLSDGKSISDAYKEYYIAALIGSRRWRRDLINHWTTSTFGSPLATINGKQYWGGGFDLNHLNDNPDMVKMADYLGIDKAGKDEIYAIGVSGDTDYVYAQFRVKAKSDNPFEVNNFSWMMHNAFATTAAQKGLSNVTIKSIDQIVPCVWYTRTIIDVNGIVTSDTTVYSTSYLSENTTVSSETTGTAPNTTTTTTTIITGLDNPLNHTPASLNMKTLDRNASAYHPNLSYDHSITNYDAAPILGVYPKNDLGNSELADAILAIYSIGNFFENHVPHTLNTTYIKTNYDFINRPVSWVFQTHDTFNMGDWSWLSISIAENDLFPMVVIGGSTKDDYLQLAYNNNFHVRSSNNYASVAKNLSGKIMDLIDPDSSGNKILGILVRSPYTWAIIVDGRLWFEYDYIMAMEIKEFVHLISSHLDIQAGASVGGFWGSFAGQFVGGLLSLLGELINLFFKVVEICDIMIKPIVYAITWMLAETGVISHTDMRNMRKWYKTIRNHIALAVATYGIGEYIKGASLAAEASAANVAGGGAALSAAETDMIIQGTFDASFAAIGMSDLSIKGAEIIAGSYSDILNGNLGNGYDAANSSSISEEATNPMSIIYEDGDIDFIDAIYIQMDDVWGDMIPNALSMIYS